MRDQLGVINDKLAQLELRHRGQHLRIPMIRRIFNGSFDRGGRLYCRGSSYQNMPAEQRQEIKFIIGGTAYPAVEIDYSSLHIRMAYSEAGKRVPSGDPYMIDGFGRGLVKLAVNILFNAPTRKSAVNAIAWDLYNNQGVTENESNAQARKVVAAIRRKHHRIKRFFGSDCGARFQRLDSDMAVDILTEMVERTGRCPLPMHDSFLVPEIDAETLSQIMTEVAGDYGLRLSLKESRAHDQNPIPSHSYDLLPYLSSLPPLRRSSFSLTSPCCPSPSNALLSSFPPISYFTMEVTPPDLRGSSRQIWREKAFFTVYRAIADTLRAAICAFAPRRRPQCHGPPALRGLNGASATRIAVRTS